MLVPAVTSMHVLPQYESSGSQIYLWKNLPSKNKFQSWGGGYITLNRNVIKKNLYHAQSILQSHAPSQVTLTNFNFSIMGGGTLPRRRLIKFDSS